MGRHTNEKALKRMERDALAKREADTEYLERFTEAEAAPIEHSDFALRLRMDKVRKHMKMARRLDAQRQRAESMAAKEKHNAPQK